MDFALLRPGYFTIEPSTPRRMPPSRPPLADLPRPVPSTTLAASRTAMLVAVRAIAPVAGRPPNSALPKFAIPWAISSVFESCRSPIIPSATTAHSSDSIAPSMAIARAGVSRSRKWSRLTVSSAGAGNPRGKASAPKAWTQKTPNGQPDLQGTWDYATITPLERPASAQGKLVLQTHIEAAPLPESLPTGKGDNQILAIVKALSDKISDYDDVALVSKDINIRIKARALGLHTLLGYIFGHNEPSLRLFETEVLPHV